MAGPSALDLSVGQHAIDRPAPLLSRLLRGPIRAGLHRWFDFTIDGLEHLPASGPYILAANHHNYLDGVVLAVAIPQPISFLVMPRVWRATPLHPSFHRHIRSITINLERPDIGALRQALAALEAGQVVGIFPEGPFSVRGRLEAGLHGVALLALRSRAPVVPAAIRGTYEALVHRRAYVPRRHPIRLSLGSPRVFGAGTLDHRRARASVTTQIMDDIAGLLR